MNTVPPVNNEFQFHGLNIAPKLLEILKSRGFCVPTPIQKQSIPPAIEGKDVMGIAQTGTGKTLAFGIHLLQRLASAGGMGLIILPTRELALQVNGAIQDIGGSLGLRTSVLIGGDSMERQIRALSQKPHIIIGTPGRLIDHLLRKTLHLDAVKILVLDEADRMLDMGFLPQIRRIMEHVPQERQTMCFSATMPTDIVKLVQQYMRLPVRVEVARAGTAAKEVSQEIFFVSKEGKKDLLENLLQEYSGSILIFSRTKFGTKKISQMIRRNNHTTNELHSNRTLAQRREALEGFKRGKYRVLVATDIAARGIDVSGIELVINYDLPDQPEDYVHRIGRTGRAGNLGHAISFATPDQRRDVRDIERLIRATIPVRALPAGLPPTPSIAPDTTQYAAPKRLQTQKPQHFFSRPSSRAQHWHGRKKFPPRSTLL